MDIPVPIVFYVSIVVKKTTLFKNNPNKSVKFVNFNLDLKYIE